MNGNQGEPSDTIRLAIAERMVSDCSSGRLLPLESYESMFVGFEKAVWEEYQQVRSTLQSQIAPGDDIDPMHSPLANADAHVFEDFEKIEELGRGGQGVVYLAKEKRLGRIVALKVLTSFAAFEEQLLARFLREAELASRLDHPGICTIYSSGTDGGVPFIAMQHVDGPEFGALIAHWHGDRSSESLRESARTPEVPPSLAVAPRTREALDTILELFEKIATALDAAHEIGVVHRDVKPGNLMVSSLGEPLVLDFGLARSTKEHGQSLTASGSTLGTPAYIPPEQLLGTPDEADSRWDTYSLGVTLYESLAGVHPFTKASLDQLYRAILDANADPIRRHNPAVSEDLAVVIKSAMDPDPKRRYQSTGLFAADLRRVRLRQPILAKPAGPGLRVQRWAQRNPRLAAAVALLLLIVTVGLFLVTGAWERERLKTEEHDLVQNLLYAQRVLFQSEPELWQLNERGRGLKEAWLETARDLVSKLPDLRRKLAIVRERGRPATSDEKRYAPRNRQYDRDLSAVEAKLADVSNDAQLLRAARAERNDTDPQAITSSLEAALLVEQQLRSFLETESQKLDEQVRWHFANPSDRDHGNSLEGLIAGIELLPKSLRGGTRIPEIEANLNLCLRVERVTILDRRDQWDSAIKAVAEDSRFGDFVLRKITGLIPLAADPESKLQEFAVFGTGDTPVRDENGRLTITDTTSIVIVLLPGARRVTLGPTPSEREIQLINESSRIVSLIPFFLGKYEVTQHQWTLVTGSNPSSRQKGFVDDKHVFTDRHPVEMVTWHQCDHFVRRLDLALPTEAQWEYACRAASRGRYTWSDAAGLKGRTNIAAQELVGRINRHIVAQWRDGFTLTAPVGRFSANGFSLFDMHGNVAEWCRDYYLRNLPAISLLEGDGLVHVARTENEHRTVRGGSWHANPDEVRIAHRSHRVGHDGSSAVGLRVARDCDPR